MGKILIIFLIVFFIHQVFAGCSDGQIDINSASVEELDKIIWVGPATAEKIINARTFESVDDLMKVSGIGEVKLADIKEQGLACVGDEKTIKKSEEESEEIIEETEDEAEILEEIVSNEEVEKIFKEVEAPVINLNAKTIKSEDNNEKINKGKYSLYGFVGFCVLLIVLFIIKARKNKDEFRD